MGNDIGVNLCILGGCSFFVNGGASCVPGGNSCTEARMLVADPSAFHDDILIEATRRINEILEGLPKDADGRKASFLHARIGTLLAWVKHGEESIPEDAVTAESDSETLRKALNVKGYAAASAQQPGI